MKKLPMSDMRSYPDFHSLKKENALTEEGTDAQFRFTMDLDAWLKGAEIITTGLYRKHHEVKKRAYKALIEETIKEQGALELAYGEELKDKDYLIDGLLLGIGFLPLSVDDEKVIGREYYDGIDGKPPKKTLKLGKIELIKFVPIISAESYAINMQDIYMAIQTKSLITSIGYIDEKGISWMTNCDIIPLRIDGEFLYCKKRKRQKEEKIRLKWIKFIEYSVWNENELSALDELQREAKVRESGK